MLSRLIRKNRLITNIFLLRLYMLELNIVKVTCRLYCIIFSNFDEIKRNPSYRCKFDYF